MKTAQQWIEEHAPGNGVAFLSAQDIATIQLDALAHAYTVAQSELQTHWGHDIVRAISRRLFEITGVSVPADPFHPERLHPGATPPEVPPPLKPVEVKWVMSPDEEAKLKAAAGESLWSPASPQSGGCLPPGQAAAKVVGLEDLADGKGLREVVSAAADSSLPKLSQPISEPDLDVLRKSFLKGLQPLGSRVETLEKHLAIGAQKPALDRLTYLEKRMGSTHAQLRDLQAVCFASLDRLEKDPRFVTVHLRLKAIEQQLKALKEPPVNPPAEQPMAQPSPRQPKTLELRGVYDQGRMDVVAQFPDVPVWPPLGQMIEAQLFWNGRHWECYRRPKLVVT